MKTKYLNVTLNLNKKYDEFSKLLMRNLLQKTLFNILFKEFQQLNMRSNFKNK